jgi:hypothetical protein
MELDSNIKYACTGQLEYCLAQACFMFDMLEHVSWTRNRDVCRRQNR